ncbi:MAG TPA: substrate-binding domain-containing protein, partial [Pedobacter sp.]
PDGILLAPIFYKETLPFLEKWKKLKIPFVVFNTQIEDYRPLSYIGQDSYQSGVLAARLFHYGHPDACSVLLAHIDEDISNSAHLVKKEQGFRAYFEQNNLSEKYIIRRAELQRRDYLAFMKQLDNIIENYADLKCIYVTTSKGYEIADYLEQKDVKGIHVIGYDLVPRNIYFINTGLISFVINQHPRGQGYWGIHHLADHLVFKKKVTPVKYLPLDIITKENLNYYLNEEV